MKMPVKNYLEQNIIMREREREREQETMTTYIDTYDNL